jgi:ATP/maltotriose-dependent transcriptional regulator MalT
VIEVSQGNALYVHELVRGAVESGALAQDRGFWRFAGRPSAAPSLLELVDQRLAGGGPGERDVVELLALGEPLRVTEMMALVDEGALLDAEARGLLTTAGEDVGLAHPLYGEAVRLRLPPLRARTLRLRLADVLAARAGAGADEALRIARLRLDAGADLAPALELEAARAATRAGDPDLGADLAARALDHGVGLPAVLVLARAHAMRNRHAEAEAVLAPAEPLAAAAAPEDRTLAGDYVKQRATVLQWGLRRPQEVAALADRAAGWSREPGWGKLLARVRLTYGSLDAGVGDADAAAEISADDRVAVESRRAAAALHALSLFVRGDADAGAEAAWAARPPVPLRDVGDAAVLSVLSLVVVETYHRLDEVEAYAADGLRSGVRGEDHAGAGLSALTLARLALLRGAARDAVRWLAEAEGHLAREDPFGGRLQVEALSVGVHAATGAFAETTAALERLRARAAEREPLAVQQVTIARAEGQALRLRSDADAARALLDDAARFADELPGPAALLAYEALRAGDVAGASGLLMALNDRCASRAVAAWTAHATARAARDGGALLDAAQELAALGARRFAVEAATDAAAAHLADARQDSARRAAALARELHLDGQGLDLPAVDGLDATATALTRREAQLVGLAAEGLTNADIADRLVLSVRTVETHLYRAMQKLGVNDRRDLRPPQH